MTIRKTAQWQLLIDDRILEHLRDECWSRPEFIAGLPGIHASEAEVRQRCWALSEAGLVAFVTEDMELVELTTWGRRYLDGEIDVGRYPSPSHSSPLEKEGSN